MTDNYCISFSGGRTSALMTAILLDDPKYKDSVIIFANTGKENEATLRFVDNCDELWGGRIVWVEYDNEATMFWRGKERKVGFRLVDFKTASRKGEPFERLIGPLAFLPNVVKRFCTQELKIRPMKMYCQKVLGWKHWTNMVGIRYDEPRRWSKSKSVTSKEVFEVEHPLVRLKVTKPHVLNFWKSMPFDLELDNEEDGNCDLCFLKGKKKKQAILRREPERFDWWIEQERKKGSTFHKDYSYEDLVDMMKRQPSLFDNAIDDTVECFCNVD